MEALKGDFIGFTFDGVHSSELGIIRTSNGSRFDKGLLPTFQDNTVSVEGSNETLYFGTRYTQKTFQISIAFDNLREYQLLELQRLIAKQKISKLIFDENPYKYYMAKISNDPKLTYICFDANPGSSRSPRIYKGEGTLTFIAYYPFARSRYKFLDQYTNESIPEWNMNNDGKGFYKNLGEWSGASRMLRTQGTYDIPAKSHINLYNAGDLETDFSLLMPISILADNQYISIEDTNGNELSRLSFYSNHKLSPLIETHVLINTRTNLIEGMQELVGGGYRKTDTLFNGSIYGGDFFKIPTGYSILKTSKAAISIEYDYLYL